MPKASEIAIELRKMADALDTEPDAQMVRPFLSWHHYSGSEKASFISIAKMMPRPFRKVVDTLTTNPVLDIQYSSSAITIYAQIPQSLTCKLIEPAKAAVYECDPILSALEEAQLEGSDVTV
jgi:hypothetical protein